MDEKRKYAIMHNWPPLYEFHSLTDFHLSFFFLVFSVPFLSSVHQYCCWKLWNDGQRINFENKINMLKGLPQVIGKTIDARTEREEMMRNIIHVCVGHCGVFVASGPMCDGFEFLFNLIEVFFG